MVQPQAERADFIVEAEFLANVQTLGGHANIIQFFGYVPSGDLMAVYVLTCACV